MIGSSPEQRALGLTDALYAAAVDPQSWTAFLEAFSEELGGAAIALSVSFPGWDQRPEYYGVHLSGEFLPVFERHFKQGPLASAMTHPAFHGAFARSNDMFSDSEVAASDYYAEYMKPQGLAAEGPIAHLISSSDGRPVSGISIQRRVSGRQLTDEDLYLCNLLVPHLAAANAIQEQRLRGKLEERARTEILDRVPSGVLLIDAERRAVITNRAAQQILDSGDGLRERDGILHASLPRDERALQEQIDDVIRPDPDAALFSGDYEGSFVGISRPSGKPAYALVIMRVFAPEAHSAVGGEVAAIFITNPAAGQSSHAEIFRDLYGLTDAEADVVSLLASGLSLEAISKQRGVTVHTTRTQLKHVFAKTKTKRQGELVRLVLTGVDAFGEVLEG